MLPIRGDPTISLTRLLGTLVTKLCRPAYLAAISAALYFSVNLHPPVSGPDFFAQHVIYSSIFFASTWTTCHLFSNGVNRRLQLEGETRQTAGGLTYAFVIYLEVIKHTVGVSFVLGWIAGVLACWEYLGAGSLIVTVVACLVVSLTAFIVTYGFSNLVDNLHWPED